MNQEMLAKRNIEEKLILEQLAGVQKKILNLQQTEQNLQKGLERIRNSRARLEQVQGVNESV